MAITIAVLVSSCKKKSEIESSSESELTPPISAEQPVELRALADNYLYKSTQCFLGANNTSFRRYLTKTIQNNNYILNCFGQITRLFVDI